MYLWNLALRKGCLGYIKYILKSSLMKLPIFGWGFHILEFIPVERKWDVDEPVMRQMLPTFTNREDPLWLAVFPEGTDYTEQKCIKSQKFANENGLPVLKNVLLPKTRGFNVCLEILRGSLDAVYDVTIAYKNQCPSFLDNVFGVDPSEVHMHVRRIPLEEIPLSKDDAAAWLMNAFVLKDQLLTDFIVNGHFPQESTENQLSTVKCVANCIVVIVFTGVFTINASATVFTLQNSCSYTVWPGTLSGNGAAILGDGGFAMAPGDTIALPAPPGWSGRFWARTGCIFNDAGTGNCTTGDCGGILKCTGGGVPPVSLVEFTIASGGADSGKDFYDVSLVDGYNVGLSVRASGGSGDCQSAGCVADVNANCPKELQVVDDGGDVVACKSACAAFNTPEFCCTGEHSTSATCSPTPYSQMFKNACPAAYSYAYDDLSSTCTCAGADYFITFCPST
ncbi:UNVERIFIED_CONTAM: putative 1-acyl-sn-glycerol-3-phosphate acyltransferase 4 [Sesamum latifolium]|uniref:1-acylglycerol-3-phosphate O-acyltransferase n=1 Tax=Sesamum latifolium TaxID=2727402 RepID=A0AAW2VVP8_9LAMI